MLLIFELDQEYNQRRNGIDVYSFYDDIPGWIYGFCESQYQDSICRQEPWGSGRLLPGVGVGKVWSAVLKKLQPPLSRPVEKFNPPPSRAAKSATPSLSQPTVWYTRSIGRGPMSPRKALVQGRRHGDPKTGSKLEENTISEVFTTGHLHCPCHRVCPHHYL